MKKQTILTIVPALALLLALVPAPPAAAATKVDIAGPAGSGEFGFSVTALANGNIVVTDPYYDDNGQADVGAVYLYDGATGALISTLTGSTAYDNVGIGGVTVLPNGNYVVSSPGWHNGAAADAGAVTWGDGEAGASGPVSADNSLVGGPDDQVGSFVTALTNGHYVVGSPFWNHSTVMDVGAVTWGDGETGISGPVSEANSLMGSTADDRVGYSGVTALSNGNYVVRSPYWDNGAVVDAGAATWGDGTTGVSGAISAANSLVGSTDGDQVGYSGVTALSNGNYVVRSPGWDNGATASAGAATWGDGTTGISGVVSAANSLVGSTVNDQVGWGATALSNGNYVVRSRYWDNGAVVDAGVATWGDGSTGITGPVSAANSLVGTTANDQVGYSVTALSNGHYVVGSPYWDNGGTANAGAATWGDGATGISGPVSAANSLVGSTDYDCVGYDGVTALSNGNYIVLSHYWHNGPVDNAGAVTWGDGAAGTVGTVSAANSLVGSTADDQVGYSNVTALSNGNYVVGSPWWDNGAATDAGAATWGDGTTGVSGPISAANSLVGSTADDQVGYGGATALSNGNYVVGSPWWDHGAVENAGAATWGDGAAGTVGPISAANSLVGSTADDQVGLGSVMALTNGHYVVSSYLWDNGTATDAGAATWGNGATGISGVVSADNSLVGSTADDQVGCGGVTALSNGHYVVHSPYWEHGAVDGGAVTWGNGMAGVRGPLTDNNSVRGTAAGGGDYLNFAYDYVHNQLVVGRPADNLVTLFQDLPMRGDSTTAITAHTPDPSTIDQPVTVEYSVTSVTGTPTGSVTVSDGEVSCTGTVAEGSCTLTFTTAGTKTLTATYEGDSNYNGSTSRGVAHTVEQGAYHLFLPLVTRNP